MSGQIDTTHGYGALVTIYINELIHVIVYIAKALHEICQCLVAVCM